MKLPEQSTRGSAEASPGRGGTYSSKMEQFPPNRQRKEDFYMKIDAIKDFKTQLLWTNDLDCRRQQEQGHANRI